MYVASTDITNVNEMRYQLFRTKDGNVESGQLPPCKDCLDMHAARANYQAGIWRRSLQSNPSIPSPVDCIGWKLDDDAQLQINWMSGSPAPDVVLEFMSCKCKHACSLPSCQCVLNGLKCTDACALQSCNNMPNTDEDVTNDGHMNGLPDEDEASDDDASDAEV